MIIYNCINILLKIIFLIWWVFNYYLPRSSYKYNYYINYLICVIIQWRMLYHSAWSRRAVTSRHRGGYNQGVLRRNEADSPIYSVIHYICGLNSHPNEHFGPKFGTDNLWDICSIPLIHLFFAPLFVSEIFVL